MSVLGDRLKMEREKRGWTKKYAAEKLRLGGSTYANYEYGIRDPDTDTLVKMAQLYETTIDYLKGIDEKDLKIKDSIEELENDINIKNVEDIIKKYALKIDGREMTEEEARGFLAFVRTNRSLN